MNQPLARSTGLLLVLFTAPHPALRPQTQAGTPAAASVFLAPHYVAGDVRHYEMKASNQGWQYTLRATDTVKRDATGSFYEEIGWSGLQSNTPMTLSTASLALRQTVSLDNPRRYMTVPDLRAVQPALIGPITDLLTFYSDLLLAQQHHLGPANPHVYVEHGTPNSWADGQHYLVAEDAIDFDLSFHSDNPQDHTAAFTVRHVPPKHPQLTFAAGWMNTPVADTANNWVQVARHADGYLAEVGKETFAVQIVVDTRDGSFVAVHLDNPITAVRRVCEDAALTRCAPAVPETIHRDVSLQLLR